MPEVPHAGEHHRERRLVRGGDHLVVALAAAGLDRPRWRPARSGRSRPSRNGKKASEAATLPRRSGTVCPRGVVLGLLDGDPRASTRLICPAPMPTVAPSVGEHDGVGLDVLADRPGEQEVAQLLFGGRRVG